MFIGWYELKCLAFQTVKIIDCFAKPHCLHNTGHQVTACSFFLYCPQSSKLQERSA